MQIEDLRMEIWKEVYDALPYIDDPDMLEIVVAGAMSMLELTLELLQDMEGLDEYGDTIERYIDLDDEIY